MTQKESVELGLQLYQLLSTGKHMSRHEDQLWAACIKLLTPGGSASEGEAK